MSDSNTPDKKIAELVLNYIKADNFHSVLSTGVIGGITINSLIDLNFFTDRVTIPKSVTLEVDENGQQKEISRDTKTGVIREVQFGVLMDVNTAKTLVEWLNNNIKLIEANTNKV